MPVVMQWDSEQVRQIACLIRKAGQHLEKSREEIGHSLEALPGQKGDDPKGAAVRRAATGLARLSQHLLDQQASLLSLIKELEKADGIISQAEQSLLHHLTSVLPTSSALETGAAPTLFTPAAAGNASGGQEGFTWGTESADPQIPSFLSRYRSFFDHCAYPLAYRRYDITLSTVSVLALQGMAPLNVPDWLMEKAITSIRKESKA